MTTFTSWDTELYHHGTPGMEWYKRRYQNKDGSLTALGRIHYGVGQIKERRVQRKEERKQKREERKASNIKNMSEADLRKAIARKKLELEYKELTRSNAISKGVGVAEKVISSYIENKRRKDEAKQKEFDRKFELKRMELEKKRLEVEDKKADNDKERAIAERNKSKLDLEKLETRAGRRMLAREAKTPLIKAKAELKRAKLDQRKSHLMSRVMDIISKNQDSTWRQMFNEQELKGQALKNIGEIARTEQSKNQALKAEHETNKAKVEYDKQVAYNEGKRLEYEDKERDRKYKKDKK